MLTITKQLYDMAVACAPRGDEDVLGPLPELIVDEFDDEQVQCSLGAGYVKKVERKRIYSSYSYPRLNFGIDLQSTSRHTLSQRRTYLRATL